MKNIWYHGQLVSNSAGSGPRHIAFHEKNDILISSWRWVRKLHGRQQNAETEELQIINIANHELPGNFGKLRRWTAAALYGSRWYSNIKTGEFIAASVRGHYEIVNFKSITGRKDGTCNEASGQRELSGRSVLLKEGTFFLLWAREWDLYGNYGNL